jgi:type IV secretion system protein VirB10
MDNANKAPIGINTQQTGSPSSNPNATNDSYAAQNGQSDKLKFLQTEAQIMTDYNKATINKPLSKYEIKAGSVIPAILKTSINSDLPSQIITAVVRENVFDTVTGSYLLIPKGSTLVGRYDSNVAYGQNRLLVAWNRLIYPNGKSYNFVNGFSGADSMGRAGFEGAVDEHYWKLFGASFVMGAITGGMSYASGANNNTTNPTMGQTVAQSIGQQAAQTGLMITQKNLNIQPTIKVDAGYKFNILISSDCILEGKV